MSTDLRTVLVEAAMDYANNYLTVEKFAEHNGLTEDQARRLLTLAREVLATPHPDA